MGGLNLALAILIPLTFDTGFYGVALAGAIVLTLKNAAFTPWYAAHVMDLQARTFFRQMAAGIGATLLIFVMGSLWSHVYQINSWTELIVVGTFISALYAPCAWFFLLEPAERKVFVSMILRRRGGL